MGDIIGSYDKKSKEIINNMDSVKEFKHDVSVIKDSINNFKYNNSVTFKLLHPMHLVKNSIKNYRIKKIESGYNNIYNSSVLEFITEESGNLQTDLDNATNIVKPMCINNYIKSLKLKK